jgi:hypothetical protein
MSIERSTIRLNSERVIAYRPEIAKHLGSVPAAILYQQLLFWSDKGGRDDGFIYKTMDEITSETYLTEHQQRLARKVLIAAKWLETKLLKADGAPTLHYRCLVEFETVVYPRFRMESEKTANPNLKKVNSYITREDNIDKNLVPTEQGEPAVKDKRDPEVTQLVESFEQVLGLKLPRMQYQRRAAQTLISRVGLERAQLAIQVVAASRAHRYAPRILSLEDLRDKWNNLEAFVERERGKSKVDRELQNQINKAIDGE